MKLKQALFALVLASFASGAYAAVLWDQPPVSNGSAFVDQVFADFPTFSTYIVHDVVFGDAVNISAITTYFSNDQHGLWPAAGSATLNIFPDPLAAGHDPTSGGSFPVTISGDPGDTLACTASGLSINLPAGTYWIGLTPEIEAGTYGQEFHRQAAAFVGQPSMARNPGGDFGFGTDWFDAGVVLGSVQDWDGAITVEGTVAVGGQGDCFGPTGVPGCDDTCGGDSCPGCSDAVCGYDPFCCSVEWDGICATEASDNPGLCLPLYVELEYFTARVENGAVVLRWKTITEVDNVGFRILRLRDPGDAESLRIVTPQLIPAQGNELAGATYEHVDGSTRGAGKFYYFLEDTDVHGVATLHGPVSVVFRPKPAAGVKRGPGGAAPRLKLVPSSKR